MLAASAAIISIEQGTARSTIQRERFISRSIKTGAFFVYSDFVIPSSFVIRHSLLKTMFHHLLLSEHLANFPHGQD